MESYKNTCIIIPTLNEEENIERLIPELLRTCSDASVLIVDDNSADNTKQVIDKLQKVYPTVHLKIRTVHFGYGPSILEGLAWARKQGFKHIFTMDADFSHDYRQIPAMHALLRTHMFILGSRYVSGGGIRNWRIQRRLLSRFANWYVRAILRVPFFDVTTGFVGYQPAAIDVILDYKPHSSGYAFLVETKFVLFRNGCTVGEHPIIFVDRVHGTSKMSLHNIWESIWMPWRLRRNFTLQK